MPPLAPRGTRTQRRRANMRRSISSLRRSPGRAASMTISAVDPTALRRIILEQSRRAHVGHIGSALSVVDILAALFDGVLHGSGPGAPERDRFVLSKGHAALALYAALFLRGVLTREQLDSYCGDDSRLGVHPECDLDGVEFSTGSLGHGLSIGAA